MANSIYVFSRMRSTIRSKWGISHEHGRMVYRAVHIPRVTYAARTWFTSSARLAHKGN